MMITLAQLKEGAKRYILNDVLGQIVDWRKWVIGAFIDPYLARIDAIFMDAKYKPMLTTAGVVREGEDRINADKLREMFLAQARDQGRVSVEVPLLGPYLIGEQDINKIYEYVVTS